MLKTIITSMILAGILCCMQVFAAEYQGTSTYHITDIETKNMATTFARDLAKRDALEQAKTFSFDIPDYSQVPNNYINLMSSL